MTLTVEQLERRRAKQRDRYHKKRAEDLTGRDEDLLKRGEQTYQYTSDDITILREILSISTTENGKINPAVLAIVRNFRRNMPMAGWRDDAAHLLKRKAA